MAALLRNVGIVEKTITNQQLNGEYIEVVSI